jgi:O-antigen ligase
MQTSFEARFPAAQSRWFVRETPAVSTRGPKIAFGLLIVFLLMLYSSVAIILPQLNAYRPVLLVAAAAVGTLAIGLARTGQSLRITWPQTPLLIAFLGVAVISTFSAIYLRKAVDTTFDFSKIFLIYLVIENTVVNESRLRKILWTLVLGGLFPAIGTIQHYFAGILIEGSRGSWVGVFKNPNEDAYCLAVLIPLAIALMYKSRWHLRVLLAGIIAIDLVGIFLTFSRGGVLGLVAGLGLVGWKQKSYVIRVGMIVTLALGLSAAGAFWTRNQDFKDVSSDTTFKQRIATIIAGGRMFLDHPLLGVGPGCSIVAYPLYVPTEYLDCGCQLQLVIHNSFVQVLSELGALGFICFMALLGTSMFDAWRMQSGPIEKYATGIEVALWIFVVCSLSGGFTYTWSPYLLFGLVAATKRIRETLPSEVSPATI